jgi:hypothetical protein
MTMDTRLEISDHPAWVAILAREIAADPRGKLGLSERMGISRVYVSRVATGHIPCERVSQRFVTRLYESLEAYECPHTRAAMAPSVCRGHAARTYEELTFAEVDHWRSCQRCPRNPLSPISKSIDRKE